MNVLIADKFDNAGVEQLKAMGCKVTLNADLSGDSLREAVKANEARVLVVRSTRVPDDVLGAGASLELVVRAGAGTDTIDKSAAKERNIRVCNCPGKNSVAVAELTMGLMLSLDRRIVDNAVDLRNGVWNKKEYAKARGLKGTTLGIVGLGRIGYELAKRAKSFDMDLIYCDVVDQNALEQELGIKKVPFEQILTDSDFISVHVPGGEGTKHLIGADELAKMKSSAFIINCARGGVIDHEALASAIKAGRVGGAGLDVYENEPGSADTAFNDPIVQCSRVYGTHHIGASTQEAQSAVGEEVVRIIGEKMKGNEPPNCVNA